ncbi:MAG TPA: ATP-binding protein [Vicinamibacterales bacterium]|jgi:PAS domain S-box-containing protein
MDEEDATTDSLETWPLLAQFVRDRGRDVQAMWLERVKRRPRARGVTDSALLAFISPLLRWFADRVRPPDNAAITSLTDELARARAAEGIDEVESVARLSMLRICLLRAWAAPTTPEQSSAGTIVLDRVIDACVSAAVEDCEKNGRRALDAVESVSLASFESSTLEELLQRLLETFREPTFAVDAALILLLEGDRLRPSASIGIDIAPDVTLRIGEGFAGRIAAEKRSLSLRSVATDPLILHPGLKASGMRAAYGVPLIEEGSVVGVAAICSLTVWEFSRADRVVFDLIARRAAMAISYSRVREGLDREKAHVETLLAQLPAAVVLAEAPSGKMTLHNSQAELIWRRPFIASESVEQYGGWPGYRLDGRRLRAQEWPLARAIQSGETVLNEEIEILRGDGSRGAILVGAAPIHGPNAQIVGGVSTFVDITEKWRTERELRRTAQQAQRAEALQQIASEASQQLAEAFETGTTVMSIARIGLPRIADWCSVHELGDDGTLRLVALAHANPTRAALFEGRMTRVGEAGAVSHEVLQDQQPRVFPDVTDDMLRDWTSPEQFEAVRDFGLTSLMVLPLVARGRTLGIMRFACAESGRHFSPDDVTVAQELARRASTALDNARLYGAVQASEARLAGLISIATDAIISVDDDQRIVMFNTGAETIFGWKHDEVIGKPLDILIPERFVEIHRQHIRDFAAGSVAARKMGERKPVSGRRKDGSEFPAEAAISKLDLDGKQLFTVVLRDNTEQTRLAQEREAAIEMRDDAMQIVAHDLRTPLATILMLASMLKRRESAQEGRSQSTAEEIVHASTRMDRLIRDLLDVSRIDAGHLVLERDRVSAAQVISDGVDVAKHLIASASLDLELEVVLNLPDIWADRDRLLQIVENLIGNAAKFTPPGGRITVGATLKDRDVLFWIKDTGVGVAAEHLPFLFDRFWQLRREDRHRGAGLGLFIVKGLVEAHDGLIWVESTPGKGTAVFFTIPLAPPLEPLHAEQEPTESV